MPDTSSAAEAVHALTVPFSIFGSIYENTPVCYNGQPMAGCWPVDRFISFMAREALLPRLTKEEQLLVCPTVFAGTRSKHHATKAGMIGFDFDHAEITYDGRLEILRSLGLRSIIYTSANHQPGVDERYRVFIFIRGLIDALTVVKYTVDHVLGATDYHLLFASIHAALGGGADKSKRGPHSLFYLPGQYATAGANRFDVIDGATISPAEWFDVSPPNMTEINPPKAPDQRDLGQTDGGSLYNSRFIKPEFIADYERLGKGEHHKGQMAFMCKVAMSARAQGYACDPSWLVDVFYQLDPVRAQQDRRDLPQQAINALRWAEQTVTLPSQPQRAPLTDYPGGEEALDLFAAIKRKEIKTLNAELPPPAPLPVDMRSICEHQMELMRDPAFNFLAQRCVKIGKVWWIKLDGRWHVRQDEKTTRADLWRAYGGPHADCHIQPPHEEAADNGRNRKVPGTIDQFFSPYGGLPTLDGTIVAPSVQSDFVSFMDRGYLNIWRDHRLPMNPDMAEAAYPLLCFIRENLCGLSAATFDEIFAEITGAEPTLFRWVMMWLAANYKAPGQHLGAVLWFLGGTAGYGKGLLGRILRILYGARWVTLADSGEIKNDWCTFMENSTLIIGDEFECDGRHGLALFMKKVIGNSIYSRRDRHVGSSMQFNCANWIMTTNNLDPLVIEQDDRRHCMVLTGDRPEHVKRAQKIGRMIDSGDDQPFRGLAAILGAIEIDFGELRTAFMTSHKKALINAGVGSTAIVRWAFDTDEDWHVGEVWDTNEAFNRFCRWRDAYDKSDKTSAALFYRRIGNFKIDGRQIIEKLPNDSVRSQLRKVAYVLPETADLHKPKERPQERPDQEPEPIRVDAFFAS
jgi:hypothetical protein